MTFQRALDHALWVVAAFGAQIIPARLFFRDRRIERGVAACTETPALLVGAVLPRVEHVEFGQIAEG